MYRRLLRDQRMAGQRLTRRVMSTGQSSAVGEYAELSQYSNVGGSLTVFALPN